MTQRTAPTALSVALLGGGTVGSQVARLLTEDADLFAERVGAPLHLTGIAVRSLDRPREAAVDPALYTTDAETLVEDADIVVELMGGIEPARSLIERALRRGAVVVTGNKALLARHGAQLSALAAEHGGSLDGEAAVAAAIPILRPLRDSLAGDRVHRVMGILNGTTNFILDRMDTDGAAYDEVLAEAQRLGYAEADPTADVQGHDAAAKVAILAGLAFGGSFTIDQVDCTGIAAITAQDSAAAAEAGLVVKLLGIAERQVDGAVLRVHPTLVPREHPLAAVRGAFNAVFVEAENAGELMFYGPGAGGRETASAVLGDVVTAARHRVLGSAVRADRAGATAGPPALPITQASTSEMIVLRVCDAPGVLRDVAAVFAEHDVSIEAMRQGPDASDDAVAEAEGRSSVRLRVITHRAPQAALDAVVADLSAAESVYEVVSVLRVEGK